MGYRVLILSAIDAAEVAATKRDQQGQSKLRLVDKYLAVNGNGPAVPLHCVVWIRVNPRGLTQLLYRRLNPQAHYGVKAEQSLKRPKQLGMMCRSQHEREKD